VIVLVVVLVGAFLYFKSGIVNFKVENMSADGYKGNVDLKRKDAERELAEINNIVKGNIKMSDIEGNIAANQNWKDIKADYNYLSNSLIPAFNKDTDKNKGGSDTLKYIGSATNGAAYIKSLDSDAEAALERKGWDPINKDSAAMQQVKKLAAN
jgi:hypothetical protein